MFVDYATPQFAKRLKVHLIVHLVDCIQDFGPASGSILKDTFYI